MKAVTLRTEIPLEYTICLDSGHIRGNYYKLRRRCEISRRALFDKTRRNWQTSGCGMLAAIEPRKEKRTSMRNLPVHWSEGMFLRPQHFQAADRHWSELIATSDRWSNPYSYGVWHVEISREALAKLPTPSFGNRASHARRDNRLRPSRPDTGSR